MTAAKQAQRTPATVTHEMLAFAASKMLDNSTLELTRTSVAALSTAYDANVARIAELEAALRACIAAQGLVGAARASASDKLYGPDGIARAALKVQA